MKKVIVSIILITFIFSSVFGASLSNLSPELKIRYNNESLNVSVETTTKMTGGSYYLGSGISTSSMFGKTKESWIPYLGNSQISKIDFFQIAGYPEEAQRFKEVLDYNKRMDKIGNIVLGAGSVVSLVGLAMMLNSIYDYDSDMTGGLITSLVGLTVMTISFPIYYAKKDDSMFSISFALRIAEDYNELLIEKLSKANNK